MTITATEFKTNFGKYLDMIIEEDVLISKNGKVVAILSKPKDEKYASLMRLIDIVHTEENISLDDIRRERLSRQCKF